MRITRESIISVDSDSGGKKWQGTKSDGLFLSKKTDGARMTNNETELGRWSRLHLFRMSNLDATGIINSVDYNEQSSSRVACIG